MKIILFGSGMIGKDMLHEIGGSAEIIAFADNDSKRWNTEYEGVLVIDPKRIAEMDYDFVIICCAVGMREIYLQCAEELHIPRIKLLTLPHVVDISAESRRIFLENCAAMLNKYEGIASVAEAGVYQGDFARYINKYFPDRTLHLFDTFEGFAEKDISVEREHGYSEAKAGDHGAGSVEITMSKMPYPEKCVIHKGYFPDTANGITDQFCFINLDMDLYEPTYNGLHFFKDKMTDNGVILIHDYYVKEYHEFEGVEAAVDQFVAEFNADIEKIHKIPIGDDKSIMLIGRWNG